MMLATRSGCIAPERRITAESDSPSTSSITIKLTPSAELTSWTVTMLGCLSRAEAMASCWKRLTKSGPSPNCGGNTLIAT